MTRRALLFAAILAITACDSVPVSLRPREGGPTVNATVVTIRNVVQPGNQSWNQTLLLGPKGRARNLGEVDVWRLFDTSGNTVTYVDNIARTARTESFENILRDRKKEMAGSIPDHYPKPSFAATEEKQTLAGVEARKYTIQSGSYQRELWFGKHANIPPKLHAMMIASADPSSPLAPMMRAVDAKLLELEGYPLADVTRVPIGEEMRIIERRVVKIEEKKVSPAMFEVPRQFLDLTPKQQ